MDKLRALAFSFHLLIYYNFVFYHRTRWLSWSACVGVVEPVCVCVSEWVLLDMSRVLLTLRYYATLPSATPYVIALSSSCSPSPAAFCDMCRIHIPCILPKLNGSRNCCHGLNAVWLCQPTKPAGPTVNSFSISFSFSYCLIKRRNCFLSYLKLNYSHAEGIYIPDWTGKEVLYMLAVLSSYVTVQLGLDACILLYKTQGYKTFGASSVTFIACFL